MCQYDLSTTKIIGPLLEFGSNILTHHFTDRSLFDYMDIPGDNMCPCLSLTLPYNQCFLPGEVFYMLHLCD